MPTALTLYGIPSFSTTLSTATNWLSTGTTGTSGASHNTKCGTSTLYSEIFPQGTASAWAAAGSIGSPSGNGLLWDVTTLEGNQFVAGNWSAVCRYRIDAGTASTADIYCRAYKRSSGGVYTLIVSMVLTAQSIPAPAASSTFTWPNTSASSVNFATGDKLYTDWWATITTNNSGSGTANWKNDLASTTTTGDTNVELVTPGYQLIPATTSSGLLTLMGVG